MKLLKANPYTFKVTKNKLYFTVEFKEAFWTAYQAGMAPRKILEDFGYDLGMFGQKQIDSMVQGIVHIGGGADHFYQEGGVHNVFHSCISSCYFNWIYYRVTISTGTLKIFATFKMVSM